MKRARAEALALVNWKGVFYERYLLDRHVTALEGFNGAGKTTVMIAAYMVLLPDMVRLRFTNLGETAATGGDKGIFGRLGDPDAPSYSALDFRLGSRERLVAGVCIERRLEPHLELTPFIISGLSDEAALQDVLLDRGDVDSVPDLNRLHELVTLAGGRFKHYHAKVSDYFAELFDRGVTPLRLTNDEERTKFNEMLRTSMVGGISKALTGGLREFLFKEETGLAETLKRMRGNLDSCRRTRLEVEAAQKMEREIHEVYEAGHEMFVAAVHATRERADEAFLRFQRAQDALEKAEEAQRNLDEVLANRTQRHEALKVELAKAQTDLEEARLLADRVRTANEIFHRLETLERKRPGLAQEAERKKTERDTCVARRDRARSQLAQAQERVKVAAAGLADFQTGLEEFHRRASAFRQASQRLAEARQGLPHLDIQATNVSEARKTVSAQVGDVDSEIVRLDRELSTAAQRRYEFERIANAIAAVAGTMPDPSMAFETALALLKDLRSLDELVDELDGLPARIASTEKLAAKQKTARELAKRLGTDESPIDSLVAAHGAFKAADAGLLALRSAHTQETDSAVRAAAERSKAELEIRELEQVVLRWSSARTIAEGLALQWRQSVEGRHDIDLLQKHLQSERDRVRDQQRRSGEKRSQVAGLAEQLAHSGGLFSDDLLRARDAVDGELLAGLFDDAEIAEAGYLEAVLGPLAEAILVPDALEAAGKLSAVGNRPQHVWLVNQDSSALSMTLQDSDVERLGDSVWVPGQSGTRLTRLPDHPTLGHRAREKRVLELHLQLEQLDRDLLDLGAHIRTFDDAMAATAALLPEVDLLERHDPGPELEAARARATKHAITEKTHLDRAAELESKIVDATARRDALRDLLSDAQLLDPPDQGAEVSLLKERLDAGKRARKRLEGLSGHRRLIEDGLDVIRVVPPSESDIEAFRGQLADKKGARDQLAGPLEALRFVEENLGALDWSDAPVALAQQQKLRPALDEQHRLAAEDQEQAEGEVKGAEEALNQATEEAQKSQASLAELDATIESRRDDLAATEIEDPSDDALASACAWHDELRKRQAQLDSSERDVAKGVAEATVRLETQQAETRKLKSARDEEEGQWRPTAERWQRLQADAESAGVLRTVMTPAVIERTSAAGSVNLYQTAKTKGSLLAERLSHADGGREKGEAIRASLDAPDQEFTAIYLSAWLDAREWLRLRVPPQIAEVDDPLAGVYRLQKLYDPRRPYDLARQVVNPSSNLLSDRQHATELPASRAKSVCPISCLS